MCMVHRVGSLQSSHPQGSYSILPECFSPVVLTQIHHLNAKWEVLYCMLVYACVHICVHKCTHVVFSIALHRSLEVRSLDELEACWLTLSSRNYPLPHNAGVTGMHECPALPDLSAFWGFELRPSCLLSKYYYSQSYLSSPFKLY